MVRNILLMLLPMGSRRRRVALILKKRVFSKLKIRYMRRAVPALLKKIERAGFIQLLSDIRAALISMRAELHGCNEYEQWIQVYEPSQKELKRQRKQFHSRSVSFSIITPIDKISDTHFMGLARSLNEQTYDNWAWIIIGTADDIAQAEKLLVQLPVQQSRVHILMSNTRAGYITEAYSYTKGDYILIIQAGDTIAAHCLYSLAAQAEKGFALITFNEDQITDVESRRRNPLFKPACDYTMLTGWNYINNAYCFKKHALPDGNHFPRGGGRTQHLELLLRLSRLDIRSTHCESILYHRRAVSESMSENRYEQDMQLNAAPLLSDQSVTGKSVAFSIIILNKNSPEYIIPLLTTLIRYRTEHDFEIIVGDTGSSDEQVLKFYRQHEDLITVVTNMNYHFSRNYNQLVRDHAHGAVLGIMNNDIALTDSSVFTEIQRVFLDNDAGIVGTRLLYPSGRIQHGGVFFHDDRTRVCQPYHRLHGQESKRYPASNVLEFIPAVTGAFLFIKKELFISLHGFDEHYEEESQDIDLCMKVRRMGHDIGYIDQADVIHVENGTRPKGSVNNHDRSYFLWKWRSYIQAMILPQPVNTDRFRNVV
ncbi:MAG: glycosyltransferase [Spirochaetes bacterium]|nr:glycosyltransferase [Spirochaetota bacterium]